MADLLRKLLMSISLFDEAEVESAPLNDESSITEVKAHNRKRKTKQLNLDDLENIEIDYKLSDEELNCPKCGSQLHEMSKKVKRELIFIPPKVKVINHVEHVYSCCSCEQNDTAATIITAKRTPALIEGSIASSLVANIINDKYVKFLPLYRQEMFYQRMGINIPRQNMSNWLIRVGTMSSFRR